MKLRIIALIAVICASSCNNMVHSGSSVVTEKDGYRDYQCVFHTNNHGIKFIEANFVDSCIRYDIGDTVYMVNKHK